ncbi:MAG TPA: 4Fe-4S binding protein [Desulfobacterales bacterium]|nr:4Fe-4S binding protein [Desulfobacterales bacterium]
MNSNQKKTSLLIILCLLAALAIPLSIRVLPRPGRTHRIDLEAVRYGYSPAKIIVNRGDSVIFKPTSKDVTHGFYLDGYPVEFIIKQQGIAYQKYTWEDEKGNLKTDWDKVSEIEFVADKPGKFTFRCTQVCGNLHPFMTGELIVRPNSLYHVAVSLSVWIVLSLLLWFRQDLKPKHGRGKKINLMESIPGLKWMVKRRSLQFMLLFPGFIIFYLFIISSLWGTPVGNRNITIIIVWILWWFALKAVFVPLGGRLWCMICPLPAPAEWISRRSLTAVRFIQKPIRGLHHRFIGLQKDWPEKIRNMWLQNIIFMLMISFGIILITRPVATAILFLAILAATLFLVLFFRHRVFCLYLCPVGGFLGNYSMASVTAIRAVDPEVCHKHRDKCCLSGGPGGWACPWDQYIGEMNRNNYCGFCTECIKSCPKDNVGIFLRPFGSDRMLKGYDEMYNVIIMLVVAIAFSITMLGPYGFVKEAANVTESRQMLSFLIYLAVLWGAALVVFPGLFILTTKGARRLTGNLINGKDLTLRLSYILIPLGIFAWIAFSLPSVMVNYNYILIVLSDPLGLGWNLFGTADAPFNPFYPEWIPVIQGVILLTGLYLGISRGYHGLENIVQNPFLRVKALILPSLFALFVVNILLKLYMG